MAALDGLPARQGTALALCRLQGLSNAEAAGAMGVSIGALELLLVRARRALRGSLADLIEAHPAPTLDMRRILKGVLAEHLGADRRALDEAIFPASRAAAGQACRVAWLWPVGRPACEDAAVARPGFEAGGEKSSILRCKACCRLAS